MYSVFHETKARPPLTSYGEQAKFLFCGIHCTLVLIGARINDTETSIAILQFPQIVANVRKFQTRAPLNARFGNPQCKI